MTVVEPNRFVDVGRIRYRLRQGLSYLWTRRGTGVDERLSILLRADELELIRRLPVADRAHLLDVHDRLQRQGCRDPDLLRAALLHDIGKVDDRVRIGVTHRTAAVLLGRFTPGLMRGLASPDGKPWRRAIFLIQVHAERGAEMARMIGCNERVCWIIRHHADEGTEDEAVKLLRRADEGELP